MSTQLFAQIGAATSSTYRYFAPGDFVVKLGKIEIKDTDDGQKFIVETTVVESSDPSYKPGETVSYVVKLFGPVKKAALGEVKAFVCRLGGVPEDAGENKIAAACALVTGDKQPLAGKLARLHCDHPAAGKKFVKHHWNLHEES